MTLENNELWQRSYVAALLLIATYMRPPSVADPNMAPPRKPPGPAQDTHNCSALLAAKSEMVLPCCVT